MNTKVKNIQTRLFKVPLPEVLSDAKHGGHFHFELVTVTVTLEYGSEGTGYTNRQLMFDHYLLIISPKTY